eukprot:TRINITY_DN3030_c4_g1_i5.p1 TRINITY_DN3030_c4_g1~~TRINITY_DN3030_c4_g1_i5.p1  ORF type:complete len:219 (-),score=29.11 TRINITY_DN3030_c4_g1_i5:84-740(-)
MKKSFFEIEGLFSDYLYDSEYSPDGKHLLVACYPRAHIIDAETGRLICTLKDHTSNIHGVAFSTDGQKFATCSEDKSVIVYNLSDFSIIHIFTNNVDVYSVCFSSCSNYLFTGDFNGNLKKWSLSNGDMVLEHRLHLTVIRRLKLSLDGKYLLTGSSGWKSTAKIVNPDSLSIFNILFHEADIKAVEFHPTKRIIAVGDASNTVKLFNMEDESLFSHF